MLNLSLSNKIDFAVVFSVKNANPNGDPLNGNRPRTTYNGFGEISDVCIKRKLRDRLLETGESIFVQSSSNTKDGFPNLRTRAEATLKTTKKDEFATEACKTWFDVRAFGQVFAFKRNKREEAEEDADIVSCGIRGPVTIQSAFSLSSIDVSNLQITKSVSNEGNGHKKTPDTMGIKSRIDSAVFVFYGSMSPQLAEKTGFSDQDALKIKAILPRLFENDASSSRPAGSMRILKVIWWDHGCKNGKCSSGRIFESLKINSDGSVVVPLIKGIKPEIIEGF